MLRRVRDRFPGDFARLKDGIVLVRPLARSEFDEGTMGEWLGKTGSSVFAGIDPAMLSKQTFTRMCDNLDECVCGVLELPEFGRRVEGRRPEDDSLVVIDVTEDVLVALRAHELGHVCTRVADVERRKASDDEWGREAAADWYAYKRGFGKPIRLARRWRQRGHHRPAPGQAVWIGPDKKPVRLSRNFVFQSGG